MPVTPTYPGVYIEEIPSGVRTITGVSTSVTALVGYTQRGPTNKGVQIFNFGDFERNFGGLAASSDVSYAAQQFFLNGGSEAWVVRVASGAAKAAITLLHRVTGGTAVIDAWAVSEGIWGNNLRLDVDYDTINPASLFNLNVIEYEEQNGILQPVRSEIHRNLGMNSFSPNYAIDTINANSNLVRVSRPAAALGVLGGPPPTVFGTSESGDLSTAEVDFTKINDDHRRLAITINGDGPYEFDIFDLGGSISGANLTARLTDLAAKIQAQVRQIQPAITAFNHFTCAITASAKGIVATSGEAGEKSSVRFASASIRDAANLLKLGLSNGGREVDAAASMRPAQTGTVGGDLSALDLTTLVATPKITVNIVVGGVTVGTETLQLWGPPTAATKPASLEELRARLAVALSLLPEAGLRGATVTLIDKHLRVVAGGTNPNAELTFANASATDSTADTIRLTSGGGAESNIARYALGVGATVAAQSGAVPGNDGTAPSAGDFIGHRPTKTGIYALEDVDLFNIMCLPNVSENTVLSAALAYCDERRAFLVIDVDGSVDTVDKAKQWLTINANLRDNNSAAYFPRILAADPLQNFRLRPFAPSGAIAGLFARTDSTRGVWKAPAGTDAALRGVQGLTYKLTDPENGTLNPLGLNCLRTFPVYGSVAWGGRTLNGSDVQASEWKYIPVRRLALFLEESLYRGTKWVVFEPNDEPLWAQIRLNVGAFMHNLFRQGAFQGRTPQEAYFVKCDKETTTQNDINLGIVNIVVGFAPLKPAEFVIIKIQQIAGQIQT